MMDNPKDRHIPPPDAKLLAAGFRLTKSHPPPMMVDIVGAWIEDEIVCIEVVYMNVGGRWFTPSDAKRDEPLYWCHKCFARPLGD